MKGLAGLDRLSIEMTGAEDKGAGRVGKSAGTFPVRDRREDGCIRAGVADFAGSRVAAIGDAGDPPENDAHRAAQDVSGFAGRKKQRLPRDELKAQRKNSNCTYRAIIHRTRE